MDQPFKSGFVNIFGPPNVGKSTLVNALMGEFLVITSPKVQTTRHRILGIRSEEQYQMIFSDTPGIIEPKYKLHEKMMNQVKSALEDADVALVLHDIRKEVEVLESWASKGKWRVPVILVLNKMDLLEDEREIASRMQIMEEQFPEWKVVAISAQKEEGIDKLMSEILERLPEGPPYYPMDSMTDRPVRFFVSEIIRQHIFQLYHDEIPYHTAVLVNAYEEKPHIHVIRAEIVVARESQKRILLGKKGSLIKELGIASRKDIEKFVESKVHLELFVKVRPKWRDNEHYLREYGYHH